jgi:hypothetical protein
MSKSTDEWGRIYLPKDVHERFGDRYRIVGLPSHVAFFPVDKAPLEGIRAAVGGDFVETDGDKLKEQAREAVSREVNEDAEGRSHEGEERVLSTEQDYDTVGLARVPFKPD